ncbi:MAG TPA: 5-amino-6-(D-ribitylamino)uracil--L-tyrosine 4-hydroxyphenyl transferase CofH [Xanthobacteraceae bacterium]|nr:5-amino-6-(D-ribitylamino)uracil--L-tyrosine 4-hydroxyphenyl transferase CofH [Xanthobacteraceae bacterium]
MPSICAGLRAEAESVLRELEAETLADLCAQACALRSLGHGKRISYSRKVFIPLTQLCRDICGYCTFAKTPSRVKAPYLSPEEVLAIAAAGARAGCHEALFTLGDKPELRYAAARAALRRLGYASTVEYLAAMCSLVQRETGLLPHVNAGVMSEAEIALLRTVSVSQGIMLENVSERLCQRGQPHFGSPDKHPHVRLGMIAAAGRLGVPFTSGILIGIGETRLERIASLISLRNLHAEHGHIQEVIIQNFRAKSSTRMANAPEPDLQDLLWTIAAARLILGPAANLQAPPNLSNEHFDRLLDAGINDWGGVSPVTPDHVNPEAPWPALAKLEQVTEARGFHLVERLAIYPAYVNDAGRWLDPKMQHAVLRHADAEGFAREAEWSPGASGRFPHPPRRRQTNQSLQRLIDRACAGSRLSEQEIADLFCARGGDVEQICAAADALRRAVSGNVVSYVVNRNINYTNICTYRCGFCAFSKGKTSEHLRGRPYDLSLNEVRRRVQEAWDRGATEVCMQGGINPHYTGATYLAILEAAKEQVPEIHVHAFSPLEVYQGAATLGVSIPAFLEQLRRAGLGSLPGTAAEILDDEVRAIICPDKLNTEQWLGVVAAAHAAGLNTTATIMFGHVERPVHWARHLLAIRDLQERTGGFTEFVPLPFVHMEAPIYSKGRARRGPTWREALLMHAIARLVLHPLIPNIQVSWVKMGIDGAKACLQAGANDLGGTLMNESISRAAGAAHGQELAPEAMDQIISSLGRIPAQRTTLYGAAPHSRRRASYAAPPLAPLSPAAAAGALRGYA